MIPLAWPTALGSPAGSATIRARPEDFRVFEDLGFAPSGSGEHVFLQLEKRLLTTHELAEQLAKLSSVPALDVAYCGMKDRNAVTQQWFSVRLAGRPEPDWRRALESLPVQVLTVARHARKLKRGVHSGNRFELHLTQLAADRGEFEQRLQAVRERGVPNYFGSQRFGRDGSTLSQALRWQEGSGRRATRNKRSLMLSALRSWVFNELLAARVLAGTWASPQAGDYCMLQGSRSRFPFAPDDASIVTRAAAGDLHPGLPLWGRGELALNEFAAPGWTDDLAASCRFLESEGLALDYRAARLMPDDFCWQFCDDGSLQLAFSLGPGGYATAVLAELLKCSEGDVVSGDRSE